MHETGMMGPIIRRRSSSIRARKRAWFIFYDLICTLSCVCVCVSHRAAPGTVIASSRETYESAFYRAVVRS